MFNMISAIEHLQNLEYFHGCLKPSFIFMSQEKFYLFIGNFIFLNQSDFLKTLREQKKNYFSPELFERIIYPKKNINVHMPKSDVFSLGLIIIECGIGYDISLLYKDNCFDTSQLTFFFQEFSKKFYETNKMLVTTVKEMIKLDYKKRPDFKELKKVLPSYRVVCEDMRQHHKTIRDE